VRFILASASPARLATFRAAGVEPEVMVSGVDESAVTAPDTATLAGALAWAKASAVASALARRDGDAAIVLGCDSLLDVDGEPVGKPASAREAVARWRQLRGRSAILHTGHAMIETASGRTCRETVGTVVEFGQPSDDEIEDYVATGEPTAVAGGFTIDGLGGWFIEGIQGDPHNVVGVCLPVVRRMLLDLDVRLRDVGFGAAASAAARSAASRPRRQRS
jgi:septum formation protein